jgi:hypothetical protein
VLVAQRGAVGLRDAVDFVEDEGLERRSVSGVSVRQRGATATPKWILAFARMTYLDSAALRRFVSRRCSVGLHQNPLGVAREQVNLDVHARARM